jgi:hypothetical protein
LFITSIDVQVLLDHLPAGDLLSGFWLPVIPTIAVESGSRLFGVSGDFLVDFGKGGHLPLLKDIEGY